nr:hypothetical protein [uncultured Roseateles sp.]
MITRQAVWWHLRSLPARLGRLGMVGLVLCLAALVTQQHLLSPLQQLRAEEARALDLQEGQLSAELLVLARKREQERAKLPPGTAQGQDDQTSAIGRVVALGQECELMLDAGEYRQSTEPGKAIPRLTLNFATRGSYAAVRCLSTALTSEPGLRIDVLKLSRPDVSQSELGVQIQLSLPTQTKSP